MRQKRVNHKLRNVSLTSLREEIRAQKARKNHKFARQIYIAYKRNGGKSSYDKI